MKALTLPSVAVALLLAGAAPAAAQTPELPELSLEELLTVQVQPVFGASERLQPVTEAPSSVTIITADDISRYGYRKLSDLLRAVRGVVITNDRNYTYAGIRGFSQPGDYNTRILLLVNGHRINDNIYDQAYIGEELNLDIAMFERVEIIRGPASSLYGTSAFFAVINIITRTGAGIEGLKVDGAAGTHGLGMGRVSFGHVFDNGAELALSARHQNRDGNDRLYFEAFDTPETNNGIAENLDRERVSTVYGQFKWKGFTLTATAGERAKYIPTASFYTAFNNHDSPERTIDGRAMVHANYARAVGKTTVTVDASFDQVEYEGVYPYLGGDVGSEQPVATNLDFALGRRWSVSAKARRPLPGRQTLVAGAEFIDNFTQRQENRYDDPALDAWVSDESSHQTGFFVVDEIRVRPWLLLNVGLRHDRYHEFAETTPRGAVIVIPSPSQSFKYLYGRAFRAPNAYELFYYSDASDRLRPESVETHELVWEQYVGEWLRTSVSAYHSRASQLITFVALDNEEEFGFANRDTVHAKGLEFEGELRNRRGMQLTASASFQRSTDDAGERLVNWPDHMARVRGSVPGPWRGSTAAVEVHYVGARQTLAGTLLPGVALAHGAFSVPLSQRFELVAAMRNILNHRFSDPASAEHLQDAIVQYGRTARIDLRWNLTGR